MRQLNMSDAGRRRRIPVLIFLIAAILLAFVGLTLARYVMQKEESGVIETKPFYFTSDLLKDESENKEYYIDPETKSFDINILNAVDSKRITKDKIVCTITVEGGLASVHSGDGVTSALEQQIQVELEGNGEQASQRVTITPNPDAGAVTVKAASSAPYQKTLSAIFRPAPGNQYRVKDSVGSRAAVLTIIYVKTGPTDITLALPENVIPDETTSWVEKKAEAGQSYTLHIPKSGVYSIVLLKKDINQNLVKEETSFDTQISLTGVPPES